MIYQNNQTNLLLFSIVDVNLIKKKPFYIYLYWICILFELIGFVFSWTGQLLIAYIVYTTRTFHRNFCHLIVSVELQHSLSQLCRLSLLTYQFGLQKVNGCRVIDLFTSKKDTGEIQRDPTLIFCSMVRMYTYNLIVGTICMMVVERFCATIFLRDYERRRRIGFDLYHHVALGSVSVFASYLYTFWGATYTRPFFTLMLLYTLMGIGILYGSFSILYRNNKARLLMLRKSFEQDKYTLSIRFQLEENMRAFELIRHGIWAHSVGSSLGMLLFCVPFIVFEIGSPEAELSTAAFEAFGGIYMTGMQMQMVNAVPGWRRKLQLIFWKVLHPSHNRQVQVKRERQNHEQYKTARNDSEIYFQQLKIMWK